MTEESSDASAGAVPEGRYANYFEIGHNAFEFLLDFGQFYDEDGPPRRHTRIVTGPTYAKRLFETLGEAISRYEADFGAIRVE
ncbi:MAG: DUF3467 domain-containing protein [Candidatus Rokubacteria bacterium]|nr:DUF3467 domain-containing protein [Candidatus Rokubacteria bacterium]